MICFHKEHELLVQTQIGKADALDNSVCFSRGLRVPSRLLAEGLVNHEAEHGRGYPSPDLASRNSLRERLSGNVRSACGIEARIQKHLWRMLKLRNGLCVLKINDHRSRVDGKTPQFVT